MNALDDVISRIRASHGEATSAPDLAESRARFAALAPELQTAMKRAARVEGWDEAQWIDETGIVSEIIRNGDYSPEVIRTATAIYQAVGAPA